MRSTRGKYARAYSHDGPIIRRKHGHILTTDQSDAGTSTGRFPRTSAACAEMPTQPRVSSRGALPLLRKR
eukprot:4717934-Pyramimonas_sp.AAC.1